jgi:hypothetical protein
VDGDVPDDTPLAAGPAAEQAVKADPSLSELSTDELQALHDEEAARLLQLQDKRFNALYGGGATPGQQQQADAAFVKQNHRAAEVFGALQWPPA